MEGKEEGREKNKEAIATPPDLRGSPRWKGYGVKDGAHAACIEVGLRADNCGMQSGHNVSVVSLRLFCAMCFMCVKAVICNVCLICMRFAAFYA